MYKDINSILSNYDFDKFTLANLNKIIKLYKYDYKEYKSIRLKCIKYFHQYHNSIYYLLYNNNSYIDFIVDVFFDISKKCFDQIKNIDKSIKYSKILLVKLFNKITSDERFNNWYRYLLENDIETLKYRLDVLNSFDIEKRVYFDEKMNKWSISKNKINSLEFLNFMVNSNSFNSIINGNKGKIQVEKEFAFSDEIIKEILLNSIESIDEEFDQIKGFTNNSIKRYSMVSKQFYRVFSKILEQNNEYLSYEWSLGYINSVVSFSPIDNNNSNKLFRSLPSHLNYLSINKVPYDYSLEKLELLFSNIRVFHFDSNKINEQLDDKFFERDRLKKQTISNNNSGIGGNEYFSFEEEEYYQEETQNSDNKEISKFWCYPVQMPNLKEIYIGNSQSNYYDFIPLLEHLFFECGSKIENFTIVVRNLCREENFSFIDSLIESHYKSLQSITIIFLDDVYWVAIKEVLIYLQRNMDYIFESMLCIRFYHKDYGYVNIENWGEILDLDGVVYDQFKNYQSIIKIFKAKKNSLNKVE